MTTILVRAGHLSAFAFSDDPDALIEVIAKHAKAKKVSMSALSLRKHTVTQPIVDPDEKAQAEAMFGYAPAAITEIELIKGPGGLWVAQAMIEAGDARSI